MSQGASPSISLARPGAPQQGGDMSGEFGLLCAGAGAVLSPERARRIATWDFSSIDWQSFRRRAEHHGVLALVARNLKQIAKGVPVEVEQSLHANFIENLRRNLWFTGELLRIVEHLERGQVRAIPFKGPALAETAYGDLALRSFGDLDILIAPADFDRARRLLEECGYRSSKTHAPAAERLWLRTGYELAFDSSAGKNLVELQWGLMPRFYAVDLRVEDLLARAGRSYVGGREVLSLSPEDLLLVLCVHAAKHLWTRLIWVADIAETLRSQAFDWPVVESRARDLGIRRMLGVSLWLAQRLLGAHIPDHCQESMRDPEVEILGQEFAHRLEQGATYNFESSDYFRRILRLRERSGDRARYLWRLLGTPGPGDIEAVRLPEPLFPVYRMVRVFRLLRKLVS
jgi:Uncharacterised nucleotidyltransferase